MVFRPIAHITVIIAILIIGAAMVFLMWKRSARPHLNDAVRRALAVVVVALICAGPSVEGEATQVSSSVEVYMVIDRTGSMVAEDWDGKKPRIDGVRQDVATILEKMAGSRFSIISWDSGVRTELPLTTDSTAVTSYMATFVQELSESSQGSSPDRPASHLATMLEKNKQKHPQNLRTLFVFTDGETSNQDHWSANSPGEESDWDQVKPYIDGGLVIGYGSKEGGPMKVRRIGGDPTTDAQSGSDGDSGQDEYIHDRSQAGDPVAISKIDEDKLQAIASRLGVDYIHSPSTADIEGKCSSLMDGASDVAETRNLLSTYRYVVWPLALVLGALMAWEGAALAIRARSLRRSHAI